MTTLQRQRVTWTGFPGGPGVSTFYFLDALAMRDSLHTFCAILQSNMPLSVKGQLDATGDEIDSATGAITGVFAGPTSPVMDSGVAGSYAAPVGLQVQWLTLGIKNGRHVKGKTYFVPMLAGNYATDGTLVPTIVTNTVAEAADFVPAGAGHFQGVSRSASAVRAWPDAWARVHSSHAGSARPAVAGSRRRPPTQPRVSS